MHALRFLGSALAKFDRDQGFFLASAIAFQGLLCLVPFALLLISFAGYYLFADERVADQLGRYFAQAAPALDPSVRPTAAVLLVWVYYSAAVLLLGAEVTALLDGVLARQPSP
jgi:uncharacterized BrkB/YihY/UPF0761 family membrane protein